MRLLARGSQLSPSARVQAFRFRFSDRRAAHTGRERAMPRTHRRASARRENAARATCRQTYDALLEQRRGAARSAAAAAQLDRAIGRPDSADRSHLIRSSAPRDTRAACRRHAVHRAPAHRGCACGARARRQSCTGQGDSHGERWCRRNARRAQAHVARAARVRSAAHLPRLRGASHAQRRRTADAATDASRAMGGRRDRSGAAKRGYHSRPAAVTARRFGRPVDLEPRSKPTAARVCVRRDRRGARRCARISRRVRAIAGTRNPG